MIGIMEFLNSKMLEKKVPYEYGEWTSKLTYPYFVGSFQETENFYEDGRTTGVFSIDGWARGSKLKLFEYVEIIKDTFQSLYEVKDGTLFFLNYVGALPTPTGENDLYKVSITINTSEWKGNGE